MVVQPGRHKGLDNELGSICGESHLANVAEILAAPNYTVAILSVVDILTVIPNCRF